MSGPDSLQRSASYPKKNSFNTIFFTGSKTKYFGVYTLEPAQQARPIDSAQLDTALKKLWRDTRSGVAAVLDERCRHPLLKTTNWDRLIDSEFGVEPEKLIELVADANDQSEFDCSVRDACHEYLDAVHLYVDRAPMATRRRIISCQTVDKVETRGFHGYQEKSTRDRCAERLARLILMLVRIRNDDSIASKILIDDVELIASIDRIKYHDVMLEPRSVLPFIQDLLIQLFCRTLDCRTPYHQFMLYRFIVFHTMLPNDGAGYTFWTPLQISSMLSEVQFWARSMPLMELYKDEWCPDVQVRTDSGFNHVCTFLSESVNCPFNSVRELLRLLAVIVGSRLELPQFYWADEQCRTLSSASESFSISLDHLTVMCSQLASDAEMQMRTKLLYGFNLNNFERILHSEIFDHKECDAPGYSFLTEPKNNFNCVSEQFFNYIVNHCKDYFIESVSNGAIVWNLTTVQQYLKSCDEFHELFISLLHLTVGQPLRGEEASSLLLCRTANSISRSIYWINGQLCILQRYHKGMNKSGKGRYVARFVAPEHTRLCLLYLVVIRPFQQ